MVNTAKRCIVWTLIFGINGIKMINTAKRGIVWTLIFGINGITMINTAKRGRDVACHVSTKVAPFLPLVS